MIPGLEAALAVTATRWENLLADAKAIVLFGSRGAACHHSCSDWDILCVGTGQTRMHEEVDLVWVTVEQATRPGSDWIGSELANHIARHGRVLVGERLWQEDFDRQELAIARKRRQLEGRVRGMLRVWPKLNTVYRDWQLRDLRRDLQRLELLTTSGVVPPTATLDSAWAEPMNCPHRLVMMLERAKLPSSGVLSQLLV